MKQIKLLRETYKTHEGARKRAGFENAMARGEFERGDKARLYAYTIVAGNAPNTYRVARCIQEA